jgi:hypothetical protein
MLWVFGVIMFCLMFMGGGLRVDPVLFFLLFVVLMVWMSVRVMVGFLRWVTGGGEADPVRKRREMDLRKTCRDPHCGKVNVARARFCAQCGKPLPEARPGGQG